MRKLFLVFLLWPTVLLAQAPSTQVVYAISDLTHALDCFTADSSGIVTPVQLAVTLNSRQIPIFGFASVSASQNVLFVGTLESYISSFQIQASGALTEESGSPVASGLQDLGGVAASTDGRFLFVAGNSVADESLGEIAVFQIGAFGALTQISTVALAESFPSNVILSANGQILYVYS